MSDHPNPGNRYEYINQEAQCCGVAIARATRASSRRRRRTCARCRRRRRRGSGAHATDEPTADRHVGPAPSRRAPATVRVPTRAYTTYNEGNLFRVSVPSNWRELASNNSVTFAPDGAYGSNEGQSVFTHGIEIGVARNESHDLATATNELLQSLQQANPRLSRPGNYDRGTIGGRQALHTTLSNISDVTGGQEVIDVYTTQLSDGSLYYAIGVAAPRRVEPLQRRVPQGDRFDPVRTLTAACRKQVLIAVGDMCGPPRKNPGAEATAALARRILKAHPDAMILALGDNAYNRGKVDEYREHYTPTWGQPDLLGRTWSCPGNHDYRTRPRRRTSSTSASARAGTPQRSYYSLPLPAAGWHFVSLNSEIDRTRTRRSCSGCARIWRAGVPADPRHLAPAALGLGRAPRLEEAALVPERAVRRARRAVLNGHAHHYERFAPQRPDQIPDPQGSGSSWSAPAAGN
jgi:hypothetical protein